MPYRYLREKFTLGGLFHYSHPSIESLQNCFFQIQAHFKKKFPGHATFILSTREEYFKKFQFPQLIDLMCKEFKLESRDHEVQIEDVKDISNFLNGLGFDLDIQNLFMEFCGSFEGAWVAHYRITHVSIPGVFQLDSFVYIYFLGLRT